MQDPTIQEEKATFSNPVINLSYVHRFDFSFDTWLVQTRCDAMRCSLMRKKKKERHHIDYCYLDKSCTFRGQGFLQQKLLRY